jgi:hypothetical protein
MNPNYSDWTGATQQRRKNDPIFEHVLTFFKNNNNKN